MENIESSDQSIIVIKEEPMDVDYADKENKLETENSLENCSEEISKFNKKFIGVEYPGIVKNVDKMLETLGGVQAISKAFCSETPRRLELRFRPNDIYCKPACGDKEHTLGILLKVRVKHRRKKTNIKTEQKQTSTENSIVSVDVLGICDQVFKFDCFADFQFLPVHNENGVLKNIYDNLIPDGIPDISWLDKTDVSYFFPPPSFSRIDTTEGYKYSTSKKDSNVDRNIIGRTRQPRSGYTKLCSFQDTEIPEKPFKGAYNVLRIKMVGEHNLNILKKLFEDRPIWPRNGILAKTSFTNDHCKHILPAVAYYFTNGPWRTMWVRYGYNPRTDPTSRIYQTLDFRIRVGVPAANKRSTIASKSSHFVRKKTVLLNKTVSLNRPVLKKRALFKNYIFKPGSIPETKQMFYQFCDLHVPEIQAMLARLPEPGPDAVCNERTGWLPTGFDERCREILHELIRKELKKRSEIELIIDDDDDDDDEEEDDEEWEEDSDVSDSD